MIHRDLIHRRKLQISLVTTLAACAIASGGVSTSEPRRGVIVEEIVNGAGADQAGLRVGDVVLSWSKASLGGKIESPFDLTEIQIEQVPRGITVLRGRRGERELHWRLQPVPMGITVRPTLPPKILAAYITGRKLVEKGQLTEAAESWRTAAIERNKHASAEVGIWLLGQAAELSAMARQWKGVDEIYAVAIKDSAGGKPGTQVQLLRRWGDVFLKRGDFARAEDCYKRSLALNRRHRAQSFGISLSLNSLGILEWTRGNLTESEDYYLRALDIQKKMAPGSLYVANSLQNLGTIMAARGKFLEAEHYFQIALDIREKVGPHNVDFAATLANLAGAAGAQGNLSKAELYLRQSLTILEKQAPDSRELGSTLLNLGTAAGFRGNLSEAEEYFRRASLVWDKIYPESPYVANTWHNLGTVIWKSGDPATAKEYFRRELALMQKIAPNSTQVAGAMNHLGEAAALQGNPLEADEYYRGALALLERIAPNSLFSAVSLRGLAAQLAERGDLTTAEEYFLRGLVIQEKQAPLSLDTVNNLESLGHLMEKRNDFVEAEKYYRRALAIAEITAPGSAEEAESLHAIGIIQRRRGERDLASQSLDDAITALEKQTTHLGGTEEAHSGFRTQHVDYYKDYLDLLVEQKQPESAFHVLERSRAQSLRELLAERDLVFAADLSSEIQRARQQNAVAYDHTQGDIAKLDPVKDGSQIEELQARLRELSAEREQITANIKRASPALADLQYPRPLNVSATREVLDPGTVMLSYSVGRDRTVLFVVQSAGLDPGLGVFTLPVTEKALRDQIEAFRNLIRGGDEVSQASMRNSARELYILLIKPAEELIASSKRVLICPDGPLHILPFSALLRKEDQYLVDWKPVHEIISATVYAQLKKTRRERSIAPLELVAFGDPQYATFKKDDVEHIRNLELRSATKRGLELAPLPASRDEVDNIAKLYSGHSQIYLGPDATEERAKSIGKDVRYLHFAVHGLLDEQFPLNSALALTIPENPSEGQENGLLQAWEIFEQVRLDADLVTLSACDTALGKEMGGEGLIGLTRAFQYAGAHSIIAAQWSVADESTADLMKGFYGHLKAGLTKDEALRQAQRELMQGTDYAHPFYWAGFSLIGDWR